MELHYRTKAALIAAVIDDAPRGIEELLAGDSRPSAAIGTLEKLSAELVFQIAQPPAECRLADIQRLGRLPQG